MRFVAPLVVIGCHAVGDPVLVNHGAIPRTGAVQVATASGHTCARMVDGTVRCWGANHGGELGDGTTIDHHSPVRVVGVEGAIDIAVSDFESCARLASGTVVCWGHREPTAHVVDKLAGASKMSSGRSLDCVRWPSGAVGCDALDTPLASATPSQNCARPGDGTVRCVEHGGRVHIGEIVEVAELRDAECVRRADHTVWCSGSNDFGQLGDGTTSAQREPVRVPGLTDVVQLAAAETHICALRASGTISCWGNDRAGQLGDGRRLVDASPPVTVVGLDHIIQVSAAFDHSCAVRDDGNVACWGSGSGGALGDGLQADRTRPVFVNWAWAPAASRGLPPGRRVTTVAVGGVHTCAALDDGSVRCWGRNDDGQVSGTRSGDSAYATPVVVPGARHVVQLALDLGDSTAVLDDGRLASWGRNQRFFIIIPTGGPVVSWQGHVFSCALHGSGAADCDEPTNQINVSVPNVAQVATSDFIGAVLYTDSTVAYAGHGPNGFPSSSSFVPIAGLTGVVQIATASWTVCARLDNGRVECVGDIEMNDHSAASTPTDMGIRDAIDVFAGPFAMCVRRRDDAVICWGWYGGIDPALDGFSTSPVEIPWLHGARFVALGHRHGCALFPRGLECWGTNENGEVGDGTMDVRPRPVPVRW
jgi:hypothetical protein